MRDINVTVESKLYKKIYSSSITKVKIKKTSRNRLQSDEQVLKYKSIYTHIHTDIFLKKKAIVYSNYRRQKNHFQQYISFLENTFFPYHKASSLRGSKTNYYQHSTKTITAFRYLSIDQTDTTNYFRVFQLPDSPALPPIPLENSNLSFTRAHTRLLFFFAFPPILPPSLSRSLVFFFRHRWQGSAALYRLCASKFSGRELHGQKPAGGVIRCANRQRRLNLTLLLLLLCVYSSGITYNSICGRRLRARRYIGVWFADTV